MASPDRWRALIALASRRGIYLFSDEIYRGAELDPARTLPQAADRHERAISLNGVSKAYGLPGLRIGWIACQDHAVLDGAERVKHYGSICSSAPSEVLARIAIRAADRLLAGTRRLIAANLPHFAEFFARHRDLFDWAPPAGGCVCYPRYLGADGAEAFCRAAVEQGGVLLLPPSIYASELADLPADRFRIGVGRADVTRSLAALGEFLDGGSQPGVSGSITTRSPFRAGVYAKVMKKLPSGKSRPFSPRTGEKMHRIRTIIASAAAVSAVAVAGAGPALASPAHRQAPAPPKTWYLSLGDSLAQGVQPDAQGKDVITNQGYPDQLFTALHPGNPTLNLKKLGCPGETTGTMMNGGICKYSGVTSQLAAAVRFLKNHKGHIQLVTIDIGANDLNKCLTLTDINALIKCLTPRIKKAVKNLGTIMKTLRAATPSSPVPIVGMTYYDPELAGWLLGTKAAKTLAQASITLASQYGLDLRQVYKAAGAPVASEFAAFHTSDFKHMVTLPAFGSVPRDVAYICSYTYECTAFHDEHANVLGYGVIAESFLKVILGG